MIAIVLIHHGPVQIVKWQPLLVHVHHQTQLPAIRAVRVIHPPPPPQGQQPPQLQPQLVTHVQFVPILRTVAPMFGQANVNNGN